VLRPLSRKPSSVIQAAVSTSWTISEQGQKLFSRRGIGATGAFAQMGIPTDEEIKEHLAVDSQVLKLPEAVSPSQIFDFSLQREVNRKLGIK
jgi:hypothetical protein